ncbi:NRDE-2, necessary for RNA interference-domain-containing protein [Peziza echinospora]|nr:NRDE-2, necessary for RNA interference-domain-containing protein [Peziza echinospora]
MRIVEDKGDGKGLVLSNTKRTDGEHIRPDVGGKQYRFAVAGGEGLRRLKVIKETDTGIGGKEFELGLEYVPLSSHKRKRDAEEPEGQIYPHSLIQGYHQDAQTQDEDLEMASSSDSEVDEMANWNSTQNRERHLELQRRITTDPSNISLWLELVHHQDNLLGPASKGRKQRATLAERQSTTEIKLSILDKALGKIKSTDKVGLEKLWACWFDVATDIWQPNELLIKYQSVLKQYPAMHSVWVRYLNFRQTDFETFKFSEMVGCYAHCMELLRDSVLHQGDDIVQKDVERLEQIALYVIFRGLRFMREAGFPEIAIATLQGLWELNFCAPKESFQSWPPSSTLQHRITLEALQEFWDSEVSRVGEAGAKGWRITVENNNGGIIPGSPTTTTGGEHDIDPLDPFGSWAQNEEESHNRQKGWPARAMDKVEEEDPFKVVLFSDISHWMFVFGQNSTHQSLVDHTLLFCGLPHGSQILITEPTLPDPDVTPDTYLVGDTLEKGDWFWPVKPTADEKLITWEGMEPERKGGLRNDAFGFKYDSGFPITLDMLFGRKSGEWVFPMTNLEQQDQAVLYIPLIRRLLQMIVRLDFFQNEVCQKYALLFLSLEWRVDSHGSMKMAKSLLKKYRTSIVLWTAYGQMEWRNGNIETARNVFKTALNMSHSFTNDKSNDSIILCLTWAWEELLDNDPSRALQVLAAYSASNKNGEIILDGEIQKTALLRTKRAFDDEQNRLLSVGRPFYASLYNQASALTEYLSTSNLTKGTSLDLTSSLPVYDSFLQTLEDRNMSTTITFNQCLLNGRIRLLYHHSRTSRSFKPSLLREALEQAITTTAGGGTPIRFYGHCMLGMRLSSCPGHPGSVPASIFCIWAEMRMSGDHVNTVRSIFEDAVESNSTKSSITIWRLYIEFELRERNPLRAKMLFFRALRCCPWSRDLAMLAFTRLIAILDFTELKKVFAIVTIEKELRAADAFALEELLEHIEEKQGREIYPGLPESTGKKGARGK